MNNEHRKAFPKEMMLLYIPQALYLTRLRHFMQHSDAEGVSTSLVTCLELTAGL